MYQVIYLKKAQLTLILFESLKINNCDGETRFTLAGKFEFDNVWEFYEGPPSQTKTVKKGWELFLLGYIILISRH